ncbi:MAG: hypothetical protein FGM24_00320 [Candidatus Kapabacteria bacterium]|nr:hypothetical protein [Candidatus Kapabacteria bacterium]
MTTRSVLPGWRVGLGTGLFLLGLVLPAAIPLVYMAQLDAWITGVLTAAFAIGLPELLWLLAALCIGRDGVKRLWRQTKVHARIARRRSVRLLGRYRTR